MGGKIRQLWFKWIFYAVYLELSCWLNISLSTFVVVFIWRNSATVLWNYWEKSSICWTESPICSIYSMVFLQRPKITKRLDLFCPEGEYLMTLQRRCVSFGSAFVCIVWIRIQTLGKDPENWCQADPYPDPHHCVAALWIRNVFFLIWIRILLFS